MSDLDMRLRETFDRVAESTKVHRRFDEIVAARQRRTMPRLVEGVAAFAAVVAISLLPMFLSGIPDDDVAGGVSGPADDDVAGGTPEPAGDDMAGGIPAPADTLTMDPSWLTVDSDDLAVFEALTDSGSEGHGSGWRVSLRTEAVWCLHEGGPGARTRASSFPIEEDLTVETLTTECASGNDSARNLETPPETFAVCRGVFADSAYQQWVGRYDILAGDMDGTHPGFPVVLGWQSDCVSEDVNTSFEIVLTRDFSLDQVNRARQLEIAVTGASHHNCFDYQHASALADEAAQKLGTKWLRVNFTSVDPNLSGYCYQPTIDLEWGAIYVMGMDQRITEAADTSTTVPPG